MTWYENPTPEQKLYMDTQRPLIDLAQDTCQVKGPDELAKFMRVYDYNRVSVHHRVLLDMFEDYLNERGWTMNRDFFFKHLSKPDWEVLDLTCDEFLKMTLWAFGAKWTSWPKNMLNDLWNKRHSDIFELKNADKVNDGMHRICGAWKTAGKP